MGSKGEFQVCRALSVLPASPWHGLSPPRHPSGCPSGTPPAPTSSVSREGHGAAPVYVLRRKEDWLGYQRPGETVLPLNLAGLVTRWGLFLCRGEQGMQLAVSASVGCLVWVFSPHQQSEDIQGCQRCQGVSDTPKEHPGAGLRTHRPLVWPLPSYASGVPAPQSQPLHLMRGLAQSGELPSQPPHCLPNGP